MKHLLLIVTIPLIFIGCSKTVETINVIEVKPKSKISNLILKIPINFQDRGYKNIETKIFKSREELDKFLQDVKSQKGWEKRDNFLEVIRDAKIDFKLENFLIYSFMENNSKTITAVDAPISIDNKILIKIAKEEIKDRPKIDKTLYYALSYRVKKMVDTIIFESGDSKEEIKITDGIHNNK